MHVHTLDVITLILKFRLYVHVATVQCIKELDFIIIIYVSCYTECYLVDSVGECKDGSIRLVYTVFPLTAGRIGVCYNGVWGSVLSSNSWSGRNAQVACRQLGFNRCE